MCSICAIGSRPNCQEASAPALFARALAVEAPALIVDEPLASLDPGHQIDVMDLLRAEAADGALVIAVLHDLTLAARYCDRLLLIDDGCAVYGIDARVDTGGAWPTITTLGRSGR